MPAYQYGRTLDPRLNKLGRKVEDAEAKIAEGTSDKNNAWDEISAIRDEVAPDKPFRFIADNGHAYAFQLREGSVSFNADQFQALLFQTYDEKKATRLWNMVTKRALDTLLLEVAVRSKKIPQDLVDQCTTVNPDTYARVHPVWTKGDAERAKIFGIEKVD